SVLQWQILFSKFVYYCFYMETYGKILLIAIPAFLLLVLFEKWYGWKKGKDTVRNMDMVSSLSSGVTNVTKDVIGLYLVVLSYPFLLKALAITTISNTIIVYIIAFFALDFAGYWVHRLQHVTNFFWNGHIVHHSSEEFNLACALRQSVSSIVKTFAIFLLPAAILGVPPQVIGVVAPLHLFAQFWYHTQHINKMGFLEHIIVTPSHHRVHHAINKEYLDKNLGQIFIFWDKLFGTYQKELEEAPPVYGITRPVRTWNPIKINFQHLWLLFQDAWRTSNWKDKLFLWFKRTGYRPADVVEKYPVYKIDDVYNFEKYDTKTSAALNIWSWVQLMMILFFVSYFFGNIALINGLGTSYIFWYGGFIFLCVYSLTELMDRNPRAIFWEALRSGTGIAFLLMQDDWFGATSYLTTVKYILGVYFILSIVTTGWLVIKHKKEDSLVLAS
ncbi:MAG TPA: sterol desaturase family protein, partial [Chitinophagaceae bacterium]|nr:sterol desaturase family protein [Chitinophagaceae bacterium]